MNMAVVSEIKRLTYALATLDLLLPELTAAGSGHDCDLVMAENGDICAICHDRLIMLPIAYGGEFDKESRRFHEEDLPFIKMRFDAFKKVINREESEDARVAAFGKPETKEKKPSIMDITRMFG